MLELKDIHVNFSYKTVLKGISLQLKEGKIYSLLGENGAGKSTLAKVLCGDIVPTAGSILLNQKKLSIKKPKDAIKNGIVCVHQRPLLVQSISIKDNLLIGIKKKEEASINALAKKWLPERKLSDIVKDLLPHEIFTVSLMGALLKNPSILILDEPPQLDNQSLRQLADSGITIIIITHSFKEAVEKSDQIVLLKDGELLEVTPASQLTENDIRKKLFGLTKNLPLPAEIKKQNITEREVLKIRENENHQLKAKAENSKEIISTGFIPYDRSFCASNPNLTVFQLCTAYHTGKKQKELEEYAIKLLQKANVNIKLYEKASNLSGGMLQRLILERELAEEPKKLYLFDPAHGLDAEVTERLYTRLEGLAKNGVNIIIGKVE